MPDNKKISQRKAVGTSLVVSISDVVLNFTVSIITGSVVMLSQVLQGISDLATAGILYKGVSNANKKADKTHQFGHGQEVFFYVLIAGLFMFVGTGIFSVFLGIDRIRNPEEIRNIWLALGMLTFGAITNLYSFNVSRKRLNINFFKKSSRDKLFHSSLIETKATLIVDALGSLAAVFGFVSLLIFVATNNTFFDGLGSVIIGLSMMSASLLLMLDAKSLIAGRAVSPKINEDIIEAATSIDGVEGVLDLRTMYLGSGKLLVLLEVHFKNDLSTDEIEKRSDQIKKSIRTYIPMTHRVQVEAETPDEELRDR